MTGDWPTVVLLGMGVFIVVGTVLPLVGHDHWTIRVFEFPRLQLAVGAVGTFVGLGMVGPSSFGTYAVTVLVGLCLIYQVDRIMLYTPLAPRQVRPADEGADGERVSVLVCNVEVENRDASTLLSVIEDKAPDLVLALETDAWWTEQLQSLTETRPYAVEQPQDDAYGMALYSRWPLVDPEVRFLVEDHVPSIHTGVSLPNGPTVRLHGLHPRPPHPTHDPDTTERDAELLHVAQTIRARDAPTIVVGDLNDVSWSYTTRLFQKVSGLLDPRIGRGIYSTFHARYPLFRYPLDHAFHSAHFTLAEMQILPYVGSDHFPVYVDLQYDPDAMDRQAEPTADAVDEAQVQHEFDRLRRKRD